MEQLYSVVREFPHREKVYFNLKPYFQVGPRKGKGKERVVESKEVVSEVSFKESESGKFNAGSNVLSETNFLDTLDEVSQSQVSFLNFN